MVSPCLLPFCQEETDLVGLCSYVSIALPEKSVPFVEEFVSSLALLTSPSSPLSSQCNITVLSDLLDKLEEV